MLSLFVDKEILSSHMQTVLSTKLTKAMRKKGSESPSETFLLGNECKK